LQETKKVQLYAGRGEIELTKAEYLYYFQQHCFNT